MSAACPAASDHDEEYVCYICGWTIEHELRKTPPVHPDDMPTATGPDRVAQAIARDRGGWAPKARVTFAQTRESPTFEDAARAEAEQRVMGSSLFAHTTRGLLVGMALWARDHLAEQDASDAEVLAALNAAGHVFSPDGHADAVDLSGWARVQVDGMRAALRAAARIRKEQER